MGFFPSQEVYVGRDVGGRRIVVSEADVARYEAGTEDRSPAYHRPSLFGEPVAPALLYHSEVYRDLSWYLPNLIGNLHARQEWELFAPFRVGDSLRSRSTIVERYRRRNRDYVVNEVLITDVEGRWLQRSRTHQSFLVDDPGESTVVDKDREKRADRRMATAEGEGPEVEALEKTATTDMCWAFSGPARNYHNDREMARALGFPDIVVQGMMSICFLSEMMTRELGEGWFCGGKLDVRLVNVFWGEESVSVRARRRDAAPEGRRARVHYDVWCEKPDGTRTVVGTASGVEG